MKSTEFPNTPMGNKNESVILTVLLLLVIHPFTNSVDLQMDLQNVGKLTLSDEKCLDDKNSNNVVCDYTKFSQVPPFTDLTYPLVSSIRVEIC
jgi:hypothetical protein